MPLVALAVLATLVLGYRFYGRFVAAQFALDDARATPAVTRNDGVDFVPTRPFYLLGQHFSAIAAAGPIAGPILACQQFGWLPCLLWIGLGVVFIGAVHDFSSLVASVRHEGRSIAEIIRVHLGRRAWLAMMAFIWVALVYVILAFADITASTFVGQDRGPGRDGLLLQPRGRGGAGVASSTSLLSVVMGLVERYLKPPLWLTTIVFVPATLVMVWLGTRYSTLLRARRRAPGACSSSPTASWPRSCRCGRSCSRAATWAASSSTSRWRSASSASSSAASRCSRRPSRAGRRAGATGALFPFLFVTIACGACSGFHGLVCSGTTSKQIAKESHCRPVGYGAMLLEAFVALIALSTVMIASPRRELAGKAPGAIYGAGAAAATWRSIDRRGAPALRHHLRRDGLLHVRLRHPRRLHAPRPLHPAGAVGLDGPGGCPRRPPPSPSLVPLVVLLVAGEGAYRRFWVLFGTSNQLLAALSLLGLSVWLRRLGKPNLFTLVPMVFVMIVTLWSLVLQVGAAAQKVAATGLHYDAVVLNGGVSVLLIVLALVLVTEAGRGWSRSAPAVKMAG